MVKKIAKAVITLVAVVVIIGALFLATGMVSHNSSSAAASRASQTASPLDQARNSALNAIINASGVKGKLQSELESSVPQISAATGLSTQQVQSGIDALDVNDWEVVSEPATATETGSYPVNANGMNATVTTYDDPSYVTVDAYGQRATFAVPNSATSYTQLLGYL